MKHYEAFLKIFFSSFLLLLFSSVDVPAYKESDFYKLKNTKKCIACDLTDLDLSRVNLSSVNLSRSDLSGSDFSGSDLSRSNLSGANLSRSNLSGTNLKNINLTGTNLNRIIIDLNAISTLELSESTFLNKSTLAEEAKKRKQLELKKKKQQELKNRIDKALNKKDIDKKSLFLKSDEKCYVAVKSSKDFEPSLLSIISISLISKFVSEVEQAPPGGISSDSCKYQISVTKNKDTTFVTFSGEGLNSSGDSKLSGLDGFQQSILKSLYRSLKNKRGLICQDYEALLDECEKIKVKKRQSGVLLGESRESRIINSLILISLI